ncbi:hypothetical protein Aau02nite_04620 [Amorphoplanes auranticolor]|uniref:Uncharacterized protein n=1 Tax=Actinoplanes auranticolor TaxID=47988 RepID=A0A919S3S6_9ACTN|nr:hypothetical protein Aau02nite_04620 [Actinoplanes auranticolor]
MTLRARSQAVARPDQAAEPEPSGLPLYESIGQASLLATPIGQVIPFGPWLQYPFGFLSLERYCWW